MDRFLSFENFQVLFYDFVQAHFAGLLHPAHGGEPCLRAFTSLLLLVS